MQKNRGMFLETIINKTINLYKQNNIAIFHKKEIPIVFKGVKKGNKLTNAYLSKKSTTDYYGIYKGKFVAFEAKSIKGISFPLVNIKKHQHNYLKKIKEHGGITFYVILFKDYDLFFIINPEKILFEIKKNITLEDIKKIGLEMELVYPGIIDFLGLIKKHQMMF